MFIVIILGILFVGFLLVSGLLALLRALGSNLGGAQSKGKLYWDSLTSHLQDSLKEGIIPFGRDPGFFHLHEIPGIPWKRMPDFLDRVKDPVEEGLNTLQWEEFCRFAKTKSVDPDSVRINYFLTRVHGALRFDTSSIHSGSREILELSGILREYLNQNKEAHKESIVFFSRPDFLKDPVGLSLRYIGVSYSNELPPHFWDKYYSLLDQSDRVSLALIHGDVDSYPGLRNSVLEAFSKLRDGYLHLFLGRFRRKLKMDEQRHLLKQGFSPVVLRNKVLLQLISIEMLEENYQHLMRKEILEEDLTRGAAMRVFSRLDPSLILPFLQNHTQFPEVRELLDQWQESGRLPTGGLSLVQGSDGDLSLSSKK